MKIRSWQAAVVLGGLMLALATGARAAEDWYGAYPIGSVSAILTSGTGTLYVDNDSAKLTVAVISEDADLSRATADNAARTQRVLNELRAQGGELKLRTTDYRVEPQRNYDAKPPKIVGYQVRNSVEVTLEGLAPDALSARVAKLLGAALDHGANSLEGVTFYVRNRTELERKSLDLATQDALARARALAEAAGVKLKRIVRLSSEPLEMEPIIRPLRAAALMPGASEAAALPVESGQSQIVGHVRLIYEIE